MEQEAISDGAQVKCYSDNDGVYTSEILMK